VQDKVEIKIKCSWKETSTYCLEKLVPSLQNTQELVLNIKRISLSVLYVYCILISALCWLNYGINKPLFMTEILSHLCHSEIHEYFVSQIVTCLQNSLPYLILSHMDPVHTFTNHLFTIPCNHLILLLCYNIQSAHFKIWNAELNLICHLIALLGAHPILHISRIRVKDLCWQ